MGESRILSKCHTSRHPVEMWHRRRSSKIPSTTCVWWGQSFARKTTTPDEIFSLIGGRFGGGCKQNAQQSTTQSFSHMSWARAPLQLWVDWATVALLASCLIRGPFSRTRTQVDCFELCFLMQQHANQAETFACAAQRCRPASGMPRLAALQMCSSQERGSP